VKQSLVIPVLVVALASFLFIPAPGAYSQENEADANVVRRETAFEKSSAQTARKARQAAAPELKAVSFEDILARPDDVALNFRFAKQQVAKNNLLGAASTLQRILLVNPSLDQIRLFYMAVLFRLDNMTEANRQIGILESRELSGSVKAELKKFKDEIAKRKRRTHASLRQSVGWGFDTNRNASPSSKKRLFANVALPVSPASGAKDDTNFLNITTVDMSHDLGFQAGHELVGSFTYFLQEQTEQDTLDLSSFQYDLGAVYKTKWFQVTPLFHASHVFLSREGFLRSQGGSVLVDRGFFGNRLRVYNRNRLEHQDFTNITENRVADQRRGNLYTLEQGATVGITPAMSVDGSIAYQHKEAKVDFNAYDRLILDVSHTWVLPKGQFVLNGLTAAFDEYDEPDVALAGRERHDRTLRYRATYGAPIGTLFFFAKSLIPGMVQDITATFTYEYYRAYSNYTNYTYHNNKIQVMLTKKWGF